MISHIDHFVLTVRSLEATCSFYERVLGFRRLDNPGNPTGLLFGQQKINIHEVTHTFDPKAVTPTPGSADFCLVADRPMGDVLRHLDECGVAIEVGPVKQTGARGLMTSVYFRDPDGNLIEVSHYEA